MRTTKPKTSNSATIVVTNLNANFTPAVTDPPSLQGTGKFMPTGLSEVKTIVTIDNMAAIVSSLVGERFSFDTEKCGKLEDQLLFFFNGSGVANEDVFSIMINPAEWPKISKFEDEENSLALITVPVFVTISNILIHRAHSKSFHVPIERDYVRGFSEVVWRKPVIKANGLQTYACYASLSRSP